MKWYEKFTSKEKPKESEEIKELKERDNKLHARIMHMEQFINKLKEAMK